MFEHRSVNCRYTIDTHWYWRFGDIPSEGSKLEADAGS